MIRNWGLNPALVVIEDEDLADSRRHVKIQSTPVDEISDEVKIRLILARMRAVRRHQEVWG
jgi:hypothetical protein